MEFAVRRNGQPVAGFGLGALASPDSARVSAEGLGSVPVAAPRAMSPWHFALVTSVVGTATGWFLEEVARRTFRRRRRYR